MTEDELRGKFTRMRAGSARREQRPSGLWTTIEKLETVADIRPLCEILSELMPSVFPLVLVRRTARVCLIRVELTL